VNPHFVLLYEIYQQIGTELYATLSCRLQSCIAITVDLSPLTSINPSLSSLTPSIHSACYNIFNKQRETVSQTEETEKQTPHEGRSMKMAFKNTPTRGVSFLFVCLFVFSKGICH
jgi:hypothetical protein